MKKIIVLTAVTTILLVGGQQNAWAGNKARQDNGDYRTFKKIVRVLDALVNDDHHKGRRKVQVRKYSFPRRVCYYRGPFEVCRFEKPGPRAYGHKTQHKKYSKKDRHDYYDQRYFKR